MSLPQERYTNLETIRKQTKSDPGLMVDLIHIYLEQTPALVSSMSRALAGKDWVVLQAAAHKIKPSFRIIGEAGVGYALANEIELLAIARESPEKIGQFLNKLEELCDHIFKELTIELQSLEKMGYYKR
jgi:HPt (histidine-containing phosphotransfer) domain-containing protein